MGAQQWEGGSLSNCNHRFIIIIRAAPPIAERPMFSVESAKEREILEDHLKTRSYVKGFTIGEEDHEQARALSEALGGDKLADVGENTRRWWTHVKSHV